jgi:hypothetical protein
VEALGQSFLMMIAFVGLLGVALVLPVSIAGGAFLLVRPAIGLWAMIPTAVLGVLTVAYEASLVIGWLGRLFERTDPAAAGIGP